MDQPTRKPKTGENGATEALELRRDAGELATLEDTATHRAAEIVREATPPTTLRARQGALGYFQAWAKVAHGQAPWPVPVGMLLDFINTHLDGLPDAVDAALVSARAKREGQHTLNTIEARVRHLSKAHRVQGLPSPASDPRVRELLSAARRKRVQGSGVRKAAAATLDILEALVATCDGERATDARDRALLLVGFASGGRRRSELAGLVVEDLGRDGGEYVWTLRASKTDQEGEGHVVPIAGRAAQALTVWLEQARIDRGPVFRAVDRWGNVYPRAMGPEQIRRMVKARAASAGLDAARLSPHSLRAGFMTETGRQGISLAEAMALSGHRTASVALGYHRVGNVLRSSAGRLVD